MGIEYNASIKVSWEDLRRLSPECCEAFMLGVGKVVAANPFRCSRCEQNTAGFSEDDPCDRCKIELSTTEERDGTTS